MLELAMLESSLQKPSEEKEEGLTAAEEQSLDTLMQSLDMSDDENDVEPMDLDSITQTLDLSEGEEGHDFNSEFGVWSVCESQSHLGVIFNSHSVTLYHFELIF